MRRKCQAKGLGRGCLEPSPGTRLLQEAKVSAGGLTLSREFRTVQGIRQLLLPNQGRGCRDMVAGGNHRVVLGDRKGDQA